MPCCVCCLVAALLFLMSFFLLLLVVRLGVFVLHVCLCVPAVLNRFPTVKLHMNNTAAPHVAADHITVWKMVGMTETHTHTHRKRERQREIICNGLLCMYSFSFHTTVFWRQQKLLAPIPINTGAHSFLQADTYGYRFLLWCKLWWSNRLLNEGLCMSGSVVGVHAWMHTCVRMHIRVCVCVCVCVS